ncbi:MAG: hypothetical protein LBD23_01850 [Oscillospiraceae bacterium]|nr:hypothetical protein [Oscillospiraceae bacterium]
MCVSSEQANNLLAEIQADDPDAKIIGEVVNKEADVILFN